MGTRIDCLKLTLTSETQTHCRWGGLTLSAADEPVEERVVTPSPAPKSPVLDVYQPQSKKPKANTACVSNDAQGFIACDNHKETEVPILVIIEKYSPQKGPLCLWSDDNRLGGCLGVSPNYFSLDARPISPGRDLLRHGGDLYYGDKENFPAGWLEFRF